MQYNETFLNACYLTIGFVDSSSDFNCDCSSLQFFRFLFLDSTKEGISLLTGGRRINFSNYPANAFVLGARKTHLASTFASEQRSFFLGSLARSVHDERVQECTGHD